VAIVLGQNQYGKAEVRLLTVARADGVHSIKDLNVGIALRGDFDACYQRGDNTNILPTDTQKNTVYAFAKRHGVNEIEDFALLLARHFVGSFPYVRGAQVRIEEYPWQRVGPDARPDAFTRAGGTTRTTLVTIEAGEPDRVGVVSGLTDLVVLKSAGSEFRGYVKDPYTTLEETSDRILATAVTAQWRFAGAAVADGIDWAASYPATRDALVTTFADAYSRSLQQTLYDMGQAALRARPEIAEIRMSMPNRHHFAVDLRPFGLDNGGEVFFPADRPYGVIEGALIRDDASDPPAPGEPPESEKRAGTQTRAGAGTPPAAASGSWEFSWNFSGR
jgi:urate oxidase